MNAPNAAGSQEDLALIQFVKETAGTKRMMPAEKPGVEQVVTLQINGNMLWKEAEAQNIVAGGKTWKTIKEHYMKDL